MDEQLVLVPKGVFLLAAHAPREVEQQLVVAAAHRRQLDHALAVAVDVAAALGVRHDRRPLEGLDLDAALRAEDHELAASVAVDLDRAHAHGRGAVRVF